MHKSYHTTYVKAKRNVIHNLNIIHETIKTSQFTMTALHLLEYFTKFVKVLTNYCDHVMMYIWQFEMSTINNKVVKCDIKTIIPKSNHIHMLLDL